MRFILLLVLQSLFSSAYADEIKLAAATSLRFVLPELVTEFERLHPRSKVNISFAASGALTSQIQHGAPFDIFLSANPEYIVRLQQAGHIKGKRVDVVQAPLALFSRNGSELTLEADLSGLKASLENNTLKKVVIANPHHAPYGQLAKQQLELHGLWNAIQSHLLIAESASQALQFSLSPQASIGFIPYNYVLQDKVIKRGSAIKLNSYLQQQAVLLKKAKPIAGEFLVFLTTVQAKEIFIRHGFKVNN